jgi:hypothetical protein
LGVDSRRSRDFAKGETEALERGGGEAQFMANKIQERIIRKKDGISIV